MDGSKISYEQALEDMCVNYDGSVRTPNQTIVQFTYGDDCLVLYKDRFGSLKLFICRTL